jgi:hypothetical protein
VIRIVSIRRFFLACLASLLAGAAIIPIETQAAEAPTPAASARPDGQHDFDFERGRWRAHNRRLLHPLTGSSEWVEFDGTLTARPIWQGRANMDEFEAGTPAGHIDGMRIETYDPKSRQWSLFSADAKSGEMGLPAAVGSFTNGRGEFFTWLASGNSPRWERAFSIDGGRTWETNWVVTLERIKDSGIATEKSQDGEAASAVPAADRDGYAGFDFELGSWNIHLKRLTHPLSGSNDWVNFDGTSVTRKVWYGRAQLEEFETDGALGHIEGLTLRTYNPTTHQWRLYWSNSRDGHMEEPQIGEFRNGVGEFYAQDVWHGKAILVRFLWSQMNTASPHFEQSFSDDGGKTWEVNWITDQAHTKDASQARR